MKVDDFVKVKTWVDQTPLRIGYTGSDEFGKYFGLYHPIGLYFIGSIREAALVKATPDELADWLHKSVATSDLITNFIKEHRMTEIDKTTYHNAGKNTVQTSGCTDQELDESIACLTNVVAFMDGQGNMRFIANYLSVELRSLERIKEMRGEHA